MMISLINNRKKKKMIFRKAVSAEKTEIMNLYRSVIGTEFCVWNDLYPGKEEIETDLETDNLFVLEDEGKIIGAISIADVNEMDEFECWEIQEDAAEFARVVIAPEYQGKGLSRLLIEGIIEEIKTRGNKAIHISVAQKNTPAFRLYQSMGFEVKEETFMYHNSYWLEEKVLM